MKILVDIKDSKTEFFLELMKYFPFVKAKILPPANADIHMGVQEAVEEMKLIKARKLKGRPAEDLFNEL